jgi:hypothetical protein
MPQVYRTFATDEDDRIVLELWSKTPPSQGELRGLLATADSFDDLPVVVDIQTRKGTACRGCGCTTDRACPGGCRWVQPDLCSACAARKGRA